MQSRIAFSCLLFCVLPVHAQNAAPKPKPITYTDPATAKDGFLLQGEYVGKLNGADFGIQVVSLGKGEFDAVLCPGGLPGAGWTQRPNPRQVVRGKTQTDSVDFEGTAGHGMLRPDGLVWTEANGGSAVLKRIERKSPTLGAQPPAGAVVLFDGKSTDAFQDGAKMTEDGLLMQGCTSKESFGDCTLHLEFRLPYMPEARGQGRGNSGLYLAGRYEVQMLDSFGLKGENNECGGIYTIAKPLVNMCLPPLTWQTYDVEFTTAKFGATGKKTADARATVKHNGVLIHDNVALTKTTTSAPISTEGTTGPIHLQNHGNEVRYRNIWVVKK